VKQREEWVSGDRSPVPVWLHKTSLGAKACTVFFFEKHAVFCLSRSLLFRCACRGWANGLIWGLGSWSGPKKRPTYTTLLIGVRVYNNSLGWVDKSRMIAQEQRCKGMSSLLCLGGHAQGWANATLLAWSLRKWEGPGKRPQSRSKRIFVPFFCSLSIKILLYVIKRWDGVRRWREIRCLWTNLNIAKLEKRPVARRFLSLGFKGKGREGKGRLPGTKNWDAKWGSEHGVGWQQLSLSQRTKVERNALAFSNPVV
jgi:hypothetical protein